MSPHVDILEQKEALGRPFIGSLLFHSGLALVIGGMSLAGGGSTFTLGSPNGGRMGAVMVNPVSIPLPNRGGQTNPVANDTKSHVPTPPPEKTTKKAAPPLDTKAVPIPIKNAPAKPSWYHPELAQNNKYRAKQDFKQNQVYSNAGQALSSPMMQMPGGGGVGLSGDNSPFGTQFGAYADLLVRQVGRVWNRPGGNFSATPRAIISFTLHRDGTIADVKISQKSGVPALDFSAQRAILDAAPFPAFPAGLNKSQVGIDFVFELSR
jgi:protein TonB